MKWCPLDRHGLHWNWLAGIRRVWGILNPISSTGKPSCTLYLSSFHYPPSLFGCWTFQWCIMTRGLSYGCLISFKSHLEKTMSSFLVRWFFAIGCLIWTLFTYLWTAFLRDLYNHPTASPLVIVLISPTIGLRFSWSSSLWSSVYFSSIRWQAW